jgi:(p)ppGpp synthase/HD superfamily hydrolase
MTTNARGFTPRYGEALILASEAHEGQVRKGTAIPYIFHPVAVSALVIEHGGDEAQAIAGLLHDVLEDGGPRYRARIADGFGPEVLEMVEHLTDGEPDARGVKPPWRARKEAYLERLIEAPDRVLLVSASDKLHNAQSIASDFEAVGAAVFDRFSQPRDETLWYYRRLQEILGQRLGTGHRLVRRLGAAIDTWAA